jgi:ATP-dependent DNA helicase RecG
MDDNELERLLSELESDRSERKGSAADKDKICEAVCAFANDLPSHGKPGVLFVGVNDNGSCAHLRVTDQLLVELAAIRSAGNILPIPSMVVQKKILNGCELAVLIVHPSDSPPVRYKGRICIRVGPRRGIASADEERHLNEKRRAKDLPFDLHPVTAATIDDLDLDFFQRVYLPSAVSPGVLEANQRTIEEQLRSLRFLSLDLPIVPTVIGLLAVGKAPADFVPGAYVQFLRLEGMTLADPIADQRELHGPLPDLLRQLDDIIRANIHVATDIRSAPTEQSRPDYPTDALQQLVRNAVMHRNYETSNAPVRVSWFADRVEIQNPGGPFGQVTRANFGQPGITDYRNPGIAEVMRNLGFVQRFGVGIAVARKALEDNGNPAPEFEVEQHHIAVTVRKRQ